MSGIIFLQCGRAEHNSTLLSLGLDKVRASEACEPFKLNTLVSLNSCLVSLNSTPVSLQLARWLEVYYLSFNYG